VAVQPAGERHREQVEGGRAHPGPAGRVEAVDLAGELAGRRGEESAGAVVTAHAHGGQPGGVVGGQREKLAREGDGHDPGGPRVRPVGGAGEVDEGEVAGMEAGLAAVLVDDDLAAGDHVHLAEVGVHHLDVPPPAVGPAWSGRRQLTDPDDAEVGGAHLVGRLAPVTGSHVERPEGGAHDLVEVLSASGGGNIVRP
jgi:hypothetical protein